LAEYTEGEVVALDADLRLHAELFSKRLARLQADTRVRLEATKRVVLSPVSINSFRPDTAALREVKQSEDCALILRLLDGQPAGFVVAAAVLHGQVRYEVNVRWATSLDAGARSDLLARMADAFAIKKAGITSRTDTASFSTLVTPDPQTLAIVPERLNRAELARITYYLQGQRGADLEISVRAACRAGDLGSFQRLAIRIDEIIRDEIRNKERWAENFISGEELATIDALRSHPKSIIDMDMVGTYAAAMEIIR
jgi:hypothetical protein